MAPRPHRSTATSEEAAAGMRLVLVLTLAVGGMAGAIGAVVAEPMVVTGLPALALGLALLAGRPEVGAWAGVTIWLALLTQAQGEAIVVPIAMAAMCLAIAVGPERLARWVRHDVLRAEGRERGEGWIEDGERRIG